MYFRYYEPLLREWVLTKMSYPKGIITRLLKYIYPNQYDWVVYIPKKQLRIRRK